MTTVRRFLRDFAPRVAGVCALVVALCGFAPAMAFAQGSPSVVIVGPSDLTLKTVTPRFTVRALGVPASARPLRLTVFVTLHSTGDSPYLDQIDTITTDTIASLLVHRLLPQNAVVYWKARLTLPDGRIFESPIAGPRLVPPWLTLIEPNKPQGNQSGTRRPLFIWSSPKIEPEFGPWMYEFQVLNGGVAVVSSSAIPDTVFRPEQELQANTGYRWQVRATTRTGETVTVQNLANFFVIDPSLPTATLIYKNFPNPFPSAAFFSTCFWFDVGVGGARISLDILDLRGNLVQRIITNETFIAGVYGRGPEGGGSNCSNRYVWDGLSNAGRPVPAGVYLARFIVAGKAPTFIKIKFNGR